MGPGIFERHLDTARHRGGSQSEFRIGKFETATSARKRDVEGFAVELVDLGTGLTLQDAGYIDPCRRPFQVGLESNREKQRLAKLRTGGCEDRKEIAQGLAGTTGHNRFERDPLSCVRAFVDDDLALSISILDLGGPLVEPGPIQPHERRIIEMTLDDVADERRLTMTVSARQIELAAAVDIAVTVIVGFALE